MEISQIELDGKIIRLEVTLWSSLGYIPREVNWIPRIECKYVECNNGYLSITDEEILQGEIQLKYDSEQIFLKFQMNFSEINDYRQILLHFCVENRLLYHYVYSTILYPLFSSRLDKRIACNCLRSLCCNFLPLITFLPGAQSDLIRKQFSLYIRLLMGYHFPKLLIRLDSINPKWHHFVVSAEDFDSTNKNNAHNAKTNLETINNTDKSNQYNSLYPYQNQNHSTSSSHVDEKNTAINSIYDRAFHEDKEDSFLVSNVAEKNSSESLSDSDSFRREEALEAHIFHNLSLDEESHGAGYGGEIEHDDGDAQGPTPNDYQQPLSSKHADCDPPVTNQPTPLISLRWVFSIFSGCLPPDALLPLWDWAVHSDNPYLGLYLTVALLGLYEDTLCQMTSTAQLREWSDDVAYCRHAWWEEGLGVGDIWKGDDKRARQGPASHSQEEGPGVGVGDERLDIVEREQCTIEIDPLGETTDEGVGYADCTVEAGVEDEEEEEEDDLVDRDCLVLLQPMRGHRTQSDGDSTPPSSSPSPPTLPPTSPGVRGSGGLHLVSLGDILVSPSQELTDSHASPQYHEDSNHTLDIGQNVNAFVTVDGHERGEGGDGVSAGSWSTGLSPGSPFTCPIESNEEASVVPGVGHDGSEYGGDCGTTGVIADIVHVEDAPAGRETSVAQDTVRSEFIDVQSSWGNVGAEEDDVVHDTGSGGSASWRVSDASRVSADVFAMGWMAITRKLIESTPESFQREVQGTVLWAQSRIQGQTLQGYGGSADGATGARGVREEASVGQGSRQGQRREDSGDMDRDMLEWSDEEVDGGERRGEDALGPGKGRDTSVSERGGKGGGLLGYYGSIWSSLPHKARGKGGGVGGERPSEADEAVPRPVVPRHIQDAPSRACLWTVAEEVLPTVCFPTRDPPSNRNVHSPSMTGGLKSLFEDTVGRVTDTLRAGARGDGEGDESVAEALLCADAISSSAQERSSMFDLWFLSPAEPSLPKHQPRYNYFVLDICDDVAQERVGRLPRSLHIPPSALSDPQYLADITEVIQSLATSSSPPVHFVLVGPGAELLWYRYHCRQTARSAVRTSKPVSESHESELLVAYDWESARLDALAMVLLKANVCHVSCLLGGYTAVVRYLLYAEGLECGRGGREDGALGLNVLVGVDEEAVEALCSASSSSPTTAAVPAHVFLPPLPSHWAPQPMSQAQKSPMTETQNFIPWHRESVYVGERYTGEKRDKVGLLRKDENSATGGGGSKGRELVGQRDGLMENFEPRAVVAEESSEDEGGNVDAAGDVNSGYSYVYQYEECDEGGGGGEGDDDKDNPPTDEMDGGYQASHKSRGGAVPSNTVTSKIVTAGQSLGGVIRGWGNAFLTRSERSSHDRSSANRADQGAASNRNMEGEGWGRERGSSTGSCGEGLGGGDGMVTSRRGTISPVVVSVSGDKDLRERLVEFSGLDIDQTYFQPIPLGGMEDEGGGTEEDGAVASGGFDYEYYLDEEDCTGEFDEDDGYREDGEYEEFPVHREVVDVEVATSQNGCEYLEMDS